MRAPERPNPSPLSSATVAIGAARFLLRRYRVGPVLVILAAAILVIGAMRHAETATANALSRWQATVEVWTTARAGSVPARRSSPGRSGRSSSPPTWYPSVPSRPIPAVCAPASNSHRRDRRRTMAHRHRVDARRTHPRGLANDQYRTTKPPLHRR